MPCKTCFIFHDGILKGECKCKLCNCYESWLWKKNYDLNRPSIENLGKITLFQESE